MKNAAILFGGKSTEHEVSRISAYNVIKAIDREKFNVIIIGINKKGEWYLCECPEEKIKDGSWEESAYKEVAVNPGKSGITVIDGEKSEFIHIDVCFPAVHGNNCEDGVLQGLLDSAGIKYVGSHVLASAACMDKVVTKIILENNGIPVTPYMYFYRGEDKIKEIEDKIGYPCFVKPVNAGSSIGASKASDKVSLQAALTEAFKYDKKVLVEKNINCRELEVAVMGNESIIAAGPGEIVSEAEFYDYDTKYITNQDVSYDIPAKLSENETKMIQDYAKKAYKLMECSGLARVDFFVDRVTSEIYLNEINTLPGFTDISMYPKLFISEGIDYKSLITRLLELASD